MKIHTSNIDYTFIHMMKMYSLSYQCFVFYAALFLSADSKVTNICHQKALENMELAVLELERNDFAVVDIILESKAAKEMTDILLTSTIWYDLTKGNAFAAHPDDGLVHSVFTKFSQEIAASMSKPSERPFRIDRYYTLAVDLSSQNTGPLSMGEEGEIIAAIWLNPSNPASLVSVHHLHHCKYH